MRFDTHLHVWWPGDGAAIRIRSTLPALDRAFTLEAVRPALRAAGVDRVLLVSSAPHASDTERLLAVAADNTDLVAGVIGWLDLEAPTLAGTLARARANPLWLGARLPLTILDDRSFIERPAVIAGLGALRDAGAIAEILAAPDQLAAVAGVLRQLPGLAAIIDHAGNPDFSAPPTAAWRTGMDRLAALPGTVCKLSAFWAPGDPPVSPERALAFFRHVLAAFGPDRVIAAANWPVSALLGPYAASWDLLAQLAGDAGLSADESARIFAGTADALVRNATP